MKNPLTRERCGSVAIHRSYHWLSTLLVGGALLSSCDSDSDSPKPSSAGSSGTGGTSNGGAAAGGKASGGSVGASGSASAGGAGAAAAGAGAPVGGEGTGGSQVSNAGAGGASVGQAGAGGGPISCTDTCPTGLECCDGRCVNTLNDPNNCGDCDTQCEEPASFCQNSCVQRPCTTTCADQDSCCGDQCCGAGQICCLSTVGAIRPVCTEPVNGTCPLGCPSCG